MVLYRMASRYGCQSRSCGREESVSNQWMREAGYSAQEKPLDAMTWQTSAQTYGQYRWMRQWIGEDTLSSQSRAARRGLPVAFLPSPAGRRPLAGSLWRSADPPDPREQGHLPLGAGKQGRMAGSKRGTV